MDPLRAVMEAYRDHHRNDDGDPDVRSLAYLDFELGESAPRAGAPFVLGLVEARLLEEVPGAPDSADALLACLRRWKSSLAAEGFASRFLRASLYAGARHQDGRVLLSLRRFFRDAR